MSFILWLAIIMIKLMNIWCPFKSSTVRYSFYSILPWKSQIDNAISSYLQFYSLSQNGNWFKVRGNDSWDLVWTCHPAILLSCNCDDIMVFVVREGERLGEAGRNILWQFLSDHGDLSLILRNIDKIHTLTLIYILIQSISPFISPVPVLKLYQASI